MLHNLMDVVAPALARTWNEGATTTPSWLSATLSLLENAGEQTPTELAGLINHMSGTNLTAEQLSHGLKKYGIRSRKSNGSRIFSLSTAEIDRLREQFRIGGAEAEEPAEAAAPPDESPDPGEQGH
jgi:hypothetical protein